MKTIKSNDFLKRGQETAYIQITTQTNYKNMSSLNIGHSQNSPEHRHFFNHWIGKCHFQNIWLFILPWQIVWQKLIWTTYRIKAQESERHSGSQQGKFSGFLRHNFYAASCVPMQSEGRKIVHCSHFYLLISFKSISVSVSNVSPKKQSDYGENQNSGKCQ